MDQERAKALETLAVLALACLLIGFWRDSIFRAALAASFLLLVGLLVSPLAILIHRGWFKLSELLSSVMGRLLLSLVFVLLLTPLAFLRRFLKKAPLDLNPPSEGLLKERDHLYRPEDFLNPY